VLSEVTIIPVEPPDPAIRKLREARDRIADLEGRIAGLEILVIGAKNEAQDMLLAERQRRLYAERARDDALQTLADEKEARRTAERDLRTLRQTIPMALAAAQNPLPKAAVVLAPVQNPLPKPAVVQARIDAAAAALPPVAAPGAVPPPATAPVVTALAPFVPVVGKKLGAQIIARRKELGMSQSALANEMKADKSLVRNWEMDVYYPSQPKLEALNRVLGITLQGNPDSIPSVEYLSSAEIAAKRRALRINQPDMARRAGVGLTAYTKWEQGRSRPSPKNMAALLAAFDAMPVPEPEPEVTQAAVPTAPEPPWLTGAELRTRRDAVGVKRIDLARLAGVSPTMVSHWEHDRYKIARKHRDAIEAALASPKPTQPAQAPRPPKAPPAPAPAPESSSFAVDIYAKRKERQLSQDALGELVGVTGVSIHNWEKGRTAPSEEKQAALLKVFAKIKPKVDMPKRILLTPVAPKPEPKPAPVAPVAPGNDVLSRRTALGLSQNRLGEMVGLTGSAIGMIERHNYAAPQRTLVAITGALDRVAATRAVVPAPAVKRPYSTSNKPVNWWSRA
jgi:transcriptional regulator with XRE-family HTH domain